MTESDLRSRVDRMVCGWIGAQMEAKEAMLRKHVTIDTAPRFHIVERTTGEHGMGEVYRVELYHRCGWTGGPDLQRGMIDAVDLPTMSMTRTVTVRIDDLVPGFRLGHMAYYKD